MMSKVIGITSVDFKIHAIGHGVVNYNGPTLLASNNADKYTVYNNHSLPKLRGFTNRTGEMKEETGYSYLKTATDIDFKKTPLYISQNCVRHHLFRDNAFDLHFAATNSLQPILASMLGLVRGYAVPSKNLKRTSPLLLEDFIDQLGNGNFEQMGRSGTKSDKKDKDGKEKKSNSFFSKTTFGDTEYISYGSINVEQLQFISLDGKFDRAAMYVTNAKSTAKSGVIDGTGISVANDIQTFIQSLDTNLNPLVTFHENYVRRGTIYQEGEAGVLLNNDAIMAVITHLLEMLSCLTIRQAKSYMYVDNILVDYNDSSKMMRIKQDDNNISEQPMSEFATYFAAK
jgi:uncharacterized protein YqkB